MRIERRPATRTRSERGTVMMMGIIVAVILTALVINLAWANGLTTQSTTGKVALNQGFFVAESGAQRALWQWKHNSYTWNSSGTWTMSVYDASTGRASANWTQTYSCVPDATVSGAYDISCTASLSGTSASTLGANCSFMVTAPSGSVTALMAGGKNGNISGAVTINGDYQTGGALNSGNSMTVTGDITLGGALNSSPHVGGNLSVKGDVNGAPTVGKNMVLTGNLNASPHVTGNLTVNGVINGTPVVGGTKTTGAHATVTVGSPPDVKAMVTTLSTQASGAGIMNNPSSVTTLNFNNAPNGIILINGDANISGAISVIGTGTVVVTGNWNQSSTFPSSGTANANIVVKGDLNISGNINVKGSMYTGNNWNQSGGFAITGVVATTVDANVSGSGTVTVATPPSFDSRTSGGGGGSASIVESKFSGPVQ